MKMLVFDLDQTLLRMDKSISEFTRKVLLEFSKKYGKVVIATGRSIVRTKNYAKQIGATGLICLNGAMVYDNNELIEKREIKPDYICDLIKELLSIRELYISIFYPTAILTNQIEFIKDGDCIYSDFRNIDINEIQKIFAFTQDEKSFYAIDFGKYDCKVTQDSYNPNLYIITNKKVNKMEGIKKLCLENGISLEDVISFGDDYNDLEMIAECGKGIAVNNACADLKLIADEICKSNDEDGPALWIYEKYLK